jgi:hypothetical protein
MRAKHTRLFPPRRYIAAALTATAALGVTALAGSTHSAESDRLVPSPLNRAGVRDG